MSRTDRYSLADMRGYHPDDKDSVAAFMTNAPNTAGHDAHD